MFLTKDGFLGIGIDVPRANQEILYCPPSNLSEVGLIVTHHLCLSSSGPDPNYNTSIDIIGSGIVQGSGGGEGGGSFPFTPPISFVTGHTTNFANPTYSGDAPIFWVRQQKLPSATQSGLDEFDTKLIVMPDGSTGINIAEPRAALDVRGSQGENRPAAIIGSRALGTGAIDPSSGLYQYKTQMVHFVPNLSNNGYNTISNNGNQGLFFTDGQGPDGANVSSSFIIAPWAEPDSFDVVGGMIMYYNGNVDFHGNLRATGLRIEAKWWSDFVFDSSYDLMNLTALDSFINSNGHLPNVPSEAEILSSGLDVAEIQAIQQMKIEELTLYIIQLNKEIESLKRLIKE